ncbi:LLM class flavin-dependent oxidoreductase, partial [Streptomyces nigrescens]
DGLFRQVEDAWDRAGRTGRPRLVAQVNAALGPQPTLDRARAELRAYYAPHSYTDHVVNGLLTSGDQIREAVAAFRAIGADEVMLYCWSPDPDQVERLAGAVFHGE